MAPTAIEAITARFTHDGRHRGRELRFGMIAVFPTTEDDRRRNKLLVAPVFRVTVRDARTLRSSTHGNEVCRCRRLMCVVRLMDSPAKWRRARASIFEKWNLSRPCWCRQRIRCIASFRWRKVARGSWCRADDLRFFPDFVEAHLAGSSFGGAFLKMHWIGGGLQMEINSGGERFVTSPVRSLWIEQDGQVHGAH
jgi:hypothetical protein